MPNDKDKQALEDAKKINSDKSSFLYKLANDNGSSSWKHNYSAWNNKDKNKDQGGKNAALPEDQDLQQKIILEDNQLFNIFLKNQLSDQMIDDQIINDKNDKNEKFDFELQDLEF
ncbi:MAG: hypothetical protein REH79_02895 [Spiroplasma sp.]|nr:hypothetical protein [Spiroplasma sp.]